MVWYKNDSAIKSLVSLRQKLMHYVDFSSTARGAIKYPSLRQFGL